MIEVASGSDVQTDMIIHRISPMSACPMSSVCGGSQQSPDPDEQNIDGATTKLDNTHCFGGPDAGLVFVNSRFEKESKVDLSVRGQHSRDEKHCDKVYPPA